jgi:TRAP-type transport system periplasmic protein
MKSRLSKSVIAGVSIAAAAMVISGAAQSHEVKLKAASFLPTRIIYAKYFGDWVKEVNKTCAGEVKISIIGPAAIKSLEQWNAVKTGVVDIHYGPANYYKGTMPEAAILDLATNENSEQRKNGAWSMMNEQHKKKMNSVYLTQIIDGIKFYIYTTKPAVGGRFSDFRLRSVPIYDAFFKGLGATPVRMGAPAIYTALERKVVDGMGWPLWAITGFGWDKFVKYRYGPGFFSAGINILVNLDKWNSLERVQRDCLMERSIWLEGVWPKWREKQSVKEIAAQNKAGIKYVDLGDGFRKKAVALYKADIRKSNPQFIDKILPLLSK